MQIVLIGNPKSGRGKGEKALCEAEAALRKRGAAVGVLRTERSGHAVELAARAAGEGADLILAVGGDGTVRDVVEGIVSSGDGVTLGILPGGTGNDFARTLCLPTKLDAALDVALGERASAVDVWRWNGKPFVNVAGIGLDAAVAEEVNRRFKNLHGTLPYVAGLLTLLPRFKPQEIKLEWADGNWSGSCWLAAFGNGRYYGGGMKICPAAVPDDGLLDVVVVEAVSKLELLKQLPGLFHGRHVAHPRVRSIQSTEFRLEAAPQNATIDGELIGRTPARITRSERPVQIKVPAG